jgi:hypothetical protein
VRPHLLRPRPPPSPPAPACLPPSRAPVALRRPRLGRPRALPATRFITIHGLTASNPTTQVRTLVAK